MFSTSDTIVAIATPPGVGGIGVVRLSGPDAFRIVVAVTGRRGPFEPRHATLVRFDTPAGAIDRVVITAFPGPHSYTGDDVAEISAHGSPVLLKTIVAETMRRGARLANPGEFTLRAYLNGRLDLVQAEAVRDLVSAVTPLQARAAFDQLEGTLTEAIRRIDARLFDLAARLEASLDFPTEGYHFVAEGETANEIDGVAAQIQHLIADSARGRLVREGVHVVLAGRPNSGKSSLFNRLAGAGRAIVTDVPGTTRDLITETIDLEGIPITLVDTAGVRVVPADAIEAEGIARATAARSVAAVVIAVLDKSVPLTAEDHDLLSDDTGRSIVVVANKSDLEAAWHDPEMGRPALQVSALTGHGLDGLRDAIVTALGGSARDREVPAITNLRHVDLLVRAGAALARAASAARQRLSEEFVLADLHEARAMLEEITGTRTPEDVVQHIFSEFCIGK